MNCNGPPLQDAIRKLASIEESGHLEELLTAFSAQCRISIGHGRPVPACVAMMQSDDRYRAERIADVAHKMLGVPLAECKRAAREVLSRDPWQDIALAIIGEYSAHSQPPRSSQKQLAAGGRKW